MKKMEKVMEKVTENNGFFCDLKSMNPVTVIQKDNETPAILQCLINLFLDKAM